MRACGCLFGSLALAFSANCQPAAPDLAEQKAILARIQEAALNYADRLQDFVCTQFTVRSADRSGTGKRWKRLDFQEQELTYAGHRESYRLLKVNGESTNLKHRVKGGYFTQSSEFGGYFRRIFDPPVKAQFIWDHQEMDAGRRLCVFRYRVPQSATTWVIQANEARIPVGHHGFVHADCETGMVMRLQIETEVSEVKPVAIQADIHYDFTTIAGKEFLAPQRVEEIARYYKTLTKVQIEFRQYRRYSTDSTITFGDEESTLANPPKR